MRVPLTRYGLPQVVIFPLIVLLLQGGLFFFPLGLPALIIARVFLCIILIWLLSFFRDPRRTIVPDDAVLYSPADATITDITIEEDSPLGQGALKIGMFLSIFNVHINRVPCRAQIVRVHYKKGQFKNAMAADSGRVNESNEVYMRRLKTPMDEIMVKQVTGAIARHIVCEAKEGSLYEQGQPFGMMKFGSRAEVYIPQGSHYQVCVEIGQKVRAGLSPLIRYH
ncbi:MAG: phosphatidylserine decarboxylase [Treponema sp.]|nr:phosphatidylserine decarboxylase [Treponema sp.]